MTMQDILCRLGLHVWLVRSTAYYKYGMGDCGKAMQCMNCKKIRTTGKAVWYD